MSEYRFQKDVRAVEGDAVEKRSKQDVEKLVERGRFPTPLGDETVRVRQRKDPRLVFRDELADAARVLGGLREQREQLRKQIPER